MPAVEEKPAETKRQPPPPFHVPLWQGKQVLWYPSADLNQLPAIAWVQKFDHRGICTLSAVGQFAQTVRTIYGARHVNDPELKVMTGQVLQACGCWDVTEPEKQANAAKTNPRNLPPLK